MLLLYTGLVTKSRFRSALFWHRDGSLKPHEVTFVQEQCVTDYYCRLLAAVHDSPHA